MTELPEPVASDEIVIRQAELDELRARNRELERVQAASTGARVRSVLRATASAVLIVVGVLCLILAPEAIWARTLVLDTDHYVATIGPVASDAGVQAAVVNVVDQQVESNLDLRGVLGQFLPDRLTTVIGPPLQSAVQGLVRNVTTTFVQSDAFRTLWQNLNRTAHQQLNYLLTGERAVAGTVALNDDGKLILDLRAVVDQVKQRLVDAGLTVANAVPSVGATIVIADVPAVLTAQRAVRWLDRAADWLPWIGVVLAGGGIALARRRRRAVIAGALGLAVGMVAVGLGVVFGRTYYLARVPPQLPGPTASFLFDTVAADLRWAARIVLLVALLVAFGSWLSGPSRPARSLRYYAATGPRRLGNRLDTGPVGPFVVRYATALRVGVIGLMFVVLILVDAPTLGMVILLAVIAVVLLLVIEFLRATALRRRPA